MNIHVQVFVWTCFFSWVYTNRWDCWVLWLPPSSFAYTSILGQGIHPTSDHSDLPCHTMSFLHLEYPAEPSTCVCVSVCMCVYKVTQSYLTLCNLRGCSSPGSSVHGILQARIRKWVAKPSSRGSSRPRD